MSKQWYIIQLFAGYEEKVKVEILKRVQEKGMEEYFGDILIPEGKTVNMFSTLEEKNEQLFPGYMVISIVPTQEAFRLVSTVNRVIRFLGGESPLPLLQEEVNRIMAQVNGEVKIVTREQTFVVGKEIDVKVGPFAGFSGIIQSVDEVRQKLIIMVSIFNRSTPVEIMFDQVQL
jgi:transcriptional antiterminator NusG